MPLVKIDIFKGVRSPQDIKHLADVVQKVMVATFNAPSRDRYQVITQHEPYEIICEDSGLELKRSSRLVIIQIFQQGRLQDAKQATYAALVERLHEECDVPAEDVIVSCVENQKEDWSFGMGRAQFLTNEL